MQLDKKNTYKILGIITFTILLYWIFQNLNTSKTIIDWTLNLFSPIIMGLCIAFIVNIPMKAIEENLFKDSKKIKNKSFAKQKNKFKRPLSILITLFLFVFVIFIVIFLLVPELIRTIGIINNGIPDIIDKTEKLFDDTMKNSPEVSSWISTLDINWNQIGENFFEFAKTKIAGLLNSTFSIANSFFSGILNFIIGLIFSIYILLQKEYLGLNIKRFLYSVLSEKHCDRLLYILKLSEKSFSNFLSAQCLEALILGSLFFVSMTIFRIPYALIISILISFTALIPIVGAFIGCFVGVLLILVTNPIQAFWFLILFLILQQIEGNLIYPRVVGNSIGLPALFVLASITLGAGISGVLGMLISVPLCSVCFVLLKEFISDKLVSKNISKQKIMNHI